MPRVASPWVVVPVALLTVLSACSSASPSEPMLTARPVQYRDDVVDGRLQLQVTNTLNESLAVVGVQLRWDGLDTDRAMQQLTIVPGQRVDLPTFLRAPTCSIDGTTVAESPSVADAAVVLTLADGSTRTAAVTDANGVLAALHHSLCQEVMLREQFELTFTDLGAGVFEGHPATGGLLRLQRRDATGTVRVVEIAGTVPFSLWFPTGGAGPLLELTPSSDAASVEVWFVEGRCDAHAVAESKQPFRFVAQVALADGSVYPLVVAPDGWLHEAMLATVAERCRQLGLDGALGPQPPVARAKVPR